MYGQGEDMFGNAEILESAGPTKTGDPEDILAEPPDARDISAELSAPPRQRLPWLTLLLSGSLVAGLAFAGGALVEKNQSQGGTPSAAARGGAAQNGQGGQRQGFGAGQGGQRQGGGIPGAAGGLTIGTVKLVDGSTIYVTDTQGNVVKVTTAGSTQVTESKSGKVSDLQPGQTVTVRGSQNASGDVAATTVTQGGASGFGGGRG
ncbi:DUF5666 domain-containing protein [Streptomyces violascens]|uniref:DUF5666 domain-containing protein n=2 Tax=Streptomyces violascens TaxID=67381 RepID=A0ABQ3QUK4_9ACTN|nr:DUF5666 domain-containing protein [Streptomyces violascens]GGU05984.1 hypothetical protein GCM10010289_28800 [Streptomyces violascens]GHI40918.1 hypothetical protein Sviol_53260 [Streptomyces violascens]